MNINENDSSPARPPQTQVDPRRPSRGAVAEQKTLLGNGTEHGFVRFLVHELRNMVAPIRNAAHILRLRSAADANLLAVADIMDRQIEGMGRLLNSLAEADRVRRDEVRLALAPIDLVPVIHDAVRASRPLLEARRHSLHLAFPDTPVRVEADAASLVQVFASVLENAAKYTQEGGDIRVDMEMAASEVCVRIRDNGSGMSSDFLPRVFDFYAAATIPQRTAKSGLGVSLAIARRLVELHAGRITAASAGPGQGSEFAIYLPLHNDAKGRAAHESGDTASPERSVSSAEKSQRQNQPTQRRILIADDNAAVRVSLCALLQDMGHAVEAASDGVAALELAQKSMPEFVFLDINMPKLNGFEVARRLRSQFPPTVMTLVMMSGTALDEPTLRGAKRVGFDHCIDKIADPQLLAGLLGTARPQGAIARNPASRTGPSPE